MSKSTFITIHVGLVGSALAALVYLLVPQFADLFRGFGETPIPFTWLVATYQWAFVLPVAGMAVVQLFRRSPRLWLAVPLSYVFAFAFVAFVVWALYLPIFVLAEGE